MPLLDIAAEKNERNREKLKESSTSTLTPMPVNVVVNEQTSQILNAQALYIQRHCVDGLLNLMKQFGLAFLELSRFDCRKAIKLLDDVPLKHRKSCWVLGHLGKAHFELAEYKEAARSAPSSLLCKNYFRFRLNAIKMWSVMAHHYFA